MKSDHRQTTMYTKPHEGTEGIARVNDTYDL
jgi:hypothetical protein